MRYGPWKVPSPIRRTWSNLPLSDSLSLRSYDHKRTQIANSYKGSYLAIFTVFRAAFGYLFLVLMVRIVGRRPGKQLTPFEFVLVFYLGGLTLTGMVGEEQSLTNAVCQILTVALCHYGLAWLRFHSNTFAQLLDGSPLILFEDQKWRSETLSQMRLQDDDVMDMARDQGLASIDQIDTAILESYGEITVLPREKE